MSIDKILTADKLRFEEVGGAVITTVSVISNDTVDIEDVNGNVDVIVPIYGNPYAKFNNPTSARYTKGSITIEDSLAGLQALSAIVDGPMKRVRLVVGGTNIPEKEFIVCILVGVSIKRSLIKGDDWVTGQISFIKL